MDSHLLIWLQWTVTYWYDYSGQSLTFISEQVASFDLLHHACERHKTVQVYIQDIFKNIITKC
jgi:hypothetical protein